MHTEPIVTILLVVAVMVLGAQSWKPLGWVAVVLVLIALLLALGVRL